MQYKLYNSNQKSTFLNSSISHRATCLLSLRQDSKCHVYSSRLGTFKLHWTWHLLHHTLADVDHRDSPSAADQSYEACDVVYASVKTRKPCYRRENRALPLWFSISLYVSNFTSRPHNLLCRALCYATIRFPPTVWPSLTRGYHVKTTPATITRSLLEDSPMTLVSSWLTSPRNYKGNIGTEDVEWEWRGKNRYALSIGTKIIDLGWPWTANTHSVAQKMRVLDFWCPLPKLEWR